MAGGYKKKTNGFKRHNSNWIRRYLKETTEVTEKERIYKRLPEEISTIIRPESATNLCQLRHVPPSQSVSSTSTSGARYRIVGVQHLSKAFSKVYSGHLLQSPECHSPEFVSPEKEEKQQGVCVSMRIVCTKCKYSSELFKMYDVIENPGPGRKPAELNIAFLVTSAVSLRDVQLLFATLNLPAPNEPGLFKNIKKQSVIASTIANNQLEKNRDVIKQIALYKGKDSIRVEMDSMFNNPPHGRQMSALATQMFTAVLECETTRHLPVAAITHNQLCSTRGDKPLCVNVHPGCTANYPVTSTMMKAKGDAAIQAYNQCLSSGLRVSEVVADGTSMISSGLKGKSVEKLECVQHVSRGQARSFYKVVDTLSAEAMGDRLPSTKKVLCNWLVNRCAAELKVARDMYRNNVDKFYAAVEHARQNILICLSGRHKECRRKSLICHGKGTKMPLPHGKSFLTLCESDVEKLQSVIDYKLSQQMAVKQRYAASTNATEAHHLRTLKLLPKSKTYKRSCHTRHLVAATVASVGIAGLTQQFAKMSHIAPPGGKSLRTLKRLQRRATYFAERQKSVDFKKSRYQLRLTKLRLNHLNRKLEGVKLTSVAPPGHDHEY